MIIDDKYKTNFNGLFLTPHQLGCKLGQMSRKGRFLERSSNELLRTGLEGPARIRPSEKHCTKRAKRVLIPSLSFDNPV